MSGENVIMALCNNLALKRGFVGNIDSSVIVQEPALAGDSSFVSKGCLDPFIP